VHVGVKALSVVNKRRVPEPQAVAGKLRVGNGGQTEEDTKGKCQVLVEGIAIKELQRIPPVGLSNEA
jgi:hypothetical protein